MPQVHKPRRNAAAHFKRAFTSRQNHANVKKNSNKGTDRLGVGKNNGTTKKINKGIEALLAAAAGAGAGGSGPSYKFVKHEKGFNPTSIKGKKQKTLNGIKKR